MNLKNFQVDVDSISSLSDTICGLRSLLQELIDRKNQEAGRPPKKKVQKIVGMFDACNRIYNSDISFLYDDLTLDRENKYYVYAHLDTSRPVVVPQRFQNPDEGGFKFFAASIGFDYFPFYIGKGTGDRCLVSERNAPYQKIVKRLTRVGKEPKIIKLKTGLTESEALQLEAKLIDLFGLVVYDGVLTNLDEGHRNQERIQLYIDDYRKLRKGNREMYGYRQVRKAGSVLMPVDSIIQYPPFPSTVPESLDEEAAVGV